VKAALRERARFSGKQQPSKVAIAGSLVAGRAEVVKAFKHGKSDPLAAARRIPRRGRDRGAATRTHSPGNTAVRDTYNFAVARGFTTIREAKLDPWT